MLKRIYRCECGKLMSESKSLVEISTDALGTVTLWGLTLLISTFVYKTLILLWTTGGLCR